MNTHYDVQQKHTIINGLKVVQKWRSYGENNISDVDKALLNGYLNSKAQSSSGYSSNQPLSQDIFKEVKECVSIFDICSMYGVELNRHNKANCCFHNEKTASLVIYPHTNSFYCFGCGAGGTVIDFVSQYFNLEPLAAAQKIDADFSLNIADTRLTEEQKELIKKRQQEALLIRVFEEWEKNYYGYVCNYIKLLKKMKQDFCPGKVRRFTRQYKFAIETLQLFEYHWDILFNGTIEEKIALYVHVNKTTRLYNVS